jgi:hypothetical protein
LRKKSNENAEELHLSSKVHEFVCLLTHSNLLTLSTSNDVMPIKGAWSIIIGRVSADGQISSTSTSDYAKTTN